MLEIASPIERLKPDCTKLAKYQLLLVLQDYSISELNAYAIYPPTRHLSQRVRPFLDFLAVDFRVSPIGIHALIT